jgi:hypothetical protein
LQNPVREEKRAKIEVNNGIMDKISNERQGYFGFFNL